MRHLLPTFDRNKVARRRPIGLFMLSCGFAWLLATNAWAQRNLTDIPDPDPTRELSEFLVAEGFEVNLYASDPMIAKPIQINFDEQGRLWVASSEVYPQLKPGQVANDKVLVLEDQNRDGVADKSTVFADGLLIPTGVIPGDGGCYVANSTELVHLRDEDGDGRADKERVILSGFGTEDTHHLLHTLRWGPDGCLYMNQSIYIHSHVETPYGVRRLNGGGIWRFNPQTYELEILCRGFVNPWGHQIDAWGQSFATDGAYREGINYVFPGSVFVTAPGESRFVAGLNPGSPKHCGLEIVGGSHLPDDWQGNMIANDFRANRVCRFVISENGSGYASRQEVELMKSSNVAFRPIDVKMGPDGAIYIADWYNPIIQHGEVDFRDPRRDQQRGRIWRVTAKGRDLSQLPEFSELSLEELFEQLRSPESWVRLFAKLHLKSRPRTTTIAAFNAWVESHFDELQDNPQLQVEALWVYQNLLAVNKKLLQSTLQSPEGRARAAAIRVSSQWREEIPQAEDWIERAVTDEHPRVRLEAVCALTALNQPSAAPRAMQALDDSVDRFLDFALWRAARELAPLWLPQLDDESQGTFAKPNHLLFALEAVDSPAVIPGVLRLIRDESLAPELVTRTLELLSRHGNPDHLRVVLDRAEEALASDPARGAILLDALQAACLRRNGLRPAGDLTSLLKFADHQQAAVRAAVCRSLGTWKIEAGRATLQGWASDDSQPSLQNLAITSLARFGDASASETLSKVAEQATRPEARRAAIAALVSLEPHAAARFAVDYLQTAESTEGLQELVRDLLSQQTGPAAFQASLAGRQLDPSIAKAVLRATQGVSKMPESLLATIRTVGSLNETQWQLTSELTSRLMQKVAAEGDPAVGEAVYRRNEMQCLNCHAIAGSGGDVGPDLVSIGASAPMDYLIESLIEPNAKIKENFHSKTLVTLDGKVVTGIPVSAGGDVLKMKLADGSLFEIADDDIEEIVDGQSLMAKGLVDPLTEIELVHLVRFLSELGKVGDYAVGNRIFVREWESLLWTPEGNRRLNRTSYDTAATDDPALSWQAAYSRVAGDLPPEELASFVIHRGLDPTAFARFNFQVESAGRVQFRFNDPSGLKMWVDGKPTPIQEVFAADFEPGSHRITLAINQKERTSGVRVELLPPAGEDDAQVRLAAE